MLIFCILCVCSLLGNVKDPSVCPNLHVFCSLCIEIWLEKSKHCPTCRVAISNEAPCRRVLGGLDASEQDDVDKLKPCEFSHAATRKARCLGLFKQYEDEIERLYACLNALNNEIASIKVLYCILFNKTGIDILLLKT